MSKIKALFFYMASGEERTSLEIAKHIKTVCTGSRVADLRKRGCNILSRFIGKSSTGALIYGYTLLSFPDGLYGVGM